MVVNVRIHGNSTKISLRPNTPLGLSTRCQSHPASPPLSKSASLAPCAWQLLHCLVHSDRHSGLTRDTHLRLHYPESVTKNHQVAFHSPLFPAPSSSPLSLHHSGRQLQTFPTCSVPPRPPCQQLLLVCSLRGSRDCLLLKEASPNLSAVSKIPSVEPRCAHEVLFLFPQRTSLHGLSPPWRKHSRPPAVPKLFPAWNSFLCASPYPEWPLIKCLWCLHVNIEIVHALCKTSWIKQESI